MRTRTSPIPDFNEFSDYFSPTATRTPGKSSGRDAAPEPEALHTTRDMDEQIDSAFEILHYNQELVQFADGKANTLILINSIALASTFGITAAIPPEYRTIATILRFAFLIASFLAVALSMAVVLSRIESGEKGRRPDLVFFADMLTRPSFPAYRTSYLRTAPSDLLEDILSRAYRVASIANRKYGWYAEAQGVTVVACALWLVFIFYVQCFV